MGLVRDAWYLTIVVAVSAVAMWILIAPIAGIATLVLGLLSFVYFAVLRYDDDGNERSDDRG